MASWNVSTGGLSDRSNLSRSNSSEMGCIPWGGQASVPRRDGCCHSHDGYRRAGRPRCMITDYDYIRYLLRGAVAPTGETVSSSSVIDRTPMGETTFVPRDGYNYFLYDLR